MQSNREFRTDVLLSIISGTFLCKFSDMHECMEYLAGGPVWTHQLPSVSREIGPRLRELFPDLADFDVSGVNRDTFKVWHAERAHLMDEMRAVPVIGGSPGGPFSGLPEGQDVVVAVVP